LGEPCPIGDQKITSQKVNWSKRWRDFEALCCDINFDLLPLLDNTFTELLISPEQRLSSPRRLLPLKTLPSSDSDYAAFRTADLWFHVQEYYKHTNYSLYIGSGRTIHLRDIQLMGEFNIYEHVNIARILSDEHQYVYKGADKLFYLPSNAKILEQELRNLELFRGSKQIVQLVAAVISSCPYQTREESRAPHVLRGILLEYHPNGTLHDVLQAPKSWMYSLWLRWAFDITTALAYMHQRGVTHMDLKPENVVMSEEWDAIVIDVSGIGGASNEWLLPELFETLEPCSETWELRVQSDTWALGKILALMAKAINDGGKEDKLLLLDIAQMVEQARGCISLEAISSRLSQVIDGRIS
jgi:hypothetical protein